MIASAERLLDALAQLRAWGHAHQQQVVDDRALEEFHRLDALVDRLAAALSITIASPATNLRCEGFTGLPLYRSNVTVAQGAPGMLHPLDVGQRDCGRWRLRACVRESDTPN
jgi:hypothetical protein